MSGVKFIVKAGTEREEFLRWLLTNAKEAESMSKQIALPAGRRSYFSGKCAALMEAHNFWSEVEIENDTPNRTFKGRGVKPLTGK